MSQVGVGCGGDTTPFDNSSKSNFTKFNLTQDATKDALAWFVSFDADEFNSIVSFTSKWVEPLTQNQTIPLNGVLYPTYSEHIIANGNESCRSIDYRNPKTSSGNINHPLDHTYFFICGGEQVENNEKSQLTALSSTDPFYELDIADHDLGQSKSLILFGISHAHSQGDLMFSKSFGRQAQKRNENVFQNKDGTK